eukprot:tig00020746_g13671.t1
MQHIPRSALVPAITNRSSVGRRSSLSFVAGWSFRRHRPPRSSSASSLAAMDRDRDPEQQPAPAPGGGLGSVAIAIAPSGSPPPPLASASNTEGAEGVDPGYSVHTAVSFSAAQSARSSPRPLVIGLDRDRDRDRDRDGPDSPRDRDRGRRHSRAAFLVVDGSAAPHLAEYCHSTLGVPSGSLAGRLREPAPPLETPEQLALASLFVPYTASAPSLRALKKLAGVRARLDQIASVGGVDPARYLAEFRPVSVLFGSLDLKATGPGEVRAAVRTAQSLLYAHEGSLRQIVLDDKGLVVIGVFGLYPLSHEEDAARCAACALELREAMEAAGVGCALGLATGLAFCAFVGDPATRCEFSVFGNAVNRAARLMGKAGRSGSGAGILADGETRAAAEQLVEMEAAGEYRLKGMPGTTAAFRPLRVRPARRAERGAGGGGGGGGGDGGGGGSGRASRRPSRSRAAALVGREAELAFIAGPQAGVGEPRSPAPAPAPAPARASTSLLVVTGNTGLGKSALARAAAAMAAAEGWRTASAAGLPTERHPFAAWRPLLAALFPMGMPEAEPLLAEDSAAAAVDPGVLADLAELLPSPGAGCDPAKSTGPTRPPSISKHRPWIPSDAATLPTHVRAAQLRAALVRLVLSRAAGAGAGAGQQPLLVVFEDATDADSQSQAALLLLAQEAGASPSARLLLLVTGRRGGGGGGGPGAGPGPGAGLLERLAGVPGHQALELLPLDGATAARLACARIGAASLPPEAAQFIADESGGVPFIAADAAERLVQDGALRVDPATGACALDPRALRHPRPSDGLRSALLWRLDRLAPSQLFLLKLASCVGMRFSAEEIAAIVPRVRGRGRGHGQPPDSWSGGPTSDPDDLAGDLAALCAAGVLRETLSGSGGEPEPGWDGGPGGAYTYEFALSPLREVVEGLLPVAERRRLHRAFAELLEARDREPPSGSMPSSGSTADPSTPGVGGPSAPGAASGGGLAAGRLAYHWLAAEDAAAARPYLERCAAAALDRFANAEAEEGYGSLLALYPGAPPPARAAWLAGLAEVCLRTGRYPSAAGYCREALALLGFRVPTSRLGLWSAVTCMALRTRLQGAPQARARAPSQSSPKSNAASFEIAHLLLELRKAAMQGGDGALFLYCGFALYRHARRLELGLGGGGGPGPGPGPGPGFLAVASAMAVRPAPAPRPRPRPRPRPARPPASLKLAACRYGYQT